MATYELQPDEVILYEGNVTCKTYKGSLQLTLTSQKVVFEKEYMIKEPDFSNEPYTVERDENGLFVVEGPRIERMLGYTNLDSEKGFEFFQKFMKTNGILDELEAMGIEEGDTVKMYGWQFDYYK